MSPTQSSNIRLRLAVFFCAVTGGATTVYAKRSPGYEAPPFLFRLMYSSIVIIPAGLLVSAILYLLFKRLRRVVSEASQRKKYWRNALLLIALATIVPALDDLNDELWEPALQGAEVLSFLAPIAIGILCDRLTKRRRVILAILSFLPAFCFFYFLTQMWQILGKHLCLPTSW